MASTVGLFIRNFQNFFDNGAHQQALMFYKLFESKQIPCKIFIEPSNPKSSLTSTKIKISKYIPIEDILYVQRDLLSNQFEKVSHIIFLTYLPNNIQFLKYLKTALKINLFYLISFNYINSFQEYVLFSQNSYISNGFSKKISRLLDVVLFDMYQNDSFLLEWYYDRKVKLIPHIWEPVLMKNVFEYNEGKSNRFEFLILEPNKSFSKNCVIPLVIAKKLCDGFTKIHITSCPTKLKRRIKNMFGNSSSNFIHHNRTNILKLIESLKKSKITPIVITHNNNNESNYLLYELIYNKIKLIHTSPSLKEYGVFYQSCDLSNLKSNFDAYLLKSNEETARQNILKKISPLYTDNSNRILNAINYYKNIII